MNVRLFPKTAFILAAGFGTRMLPLTLERPKPMFPVWGKPIIGQIIDMLLGWGVKEFIINLHHNPSNIVSFVIKNYANKACINFSFESQILGTGGALKKAEALLPDEPFWLINADIAVDLNPDQLVEMFYTNKKNIALLWMHGQLGPRTVELKADGEVANFRSCKPGTEGTYTFCGLHLVSPEILQFIPSGTPSSIIQAYIMAQSKGFKVQGVCLKNTFWADIGTPVSYLNAHRDIFQAFTNKKVGKNLFQPEQLLRAKMLQDAGCELQGFVAIGEKVKVEGGAILKNAVLWDYVELKKGAIVEDAIVGDGASINSKVRRIALKVTSFKTNSNEKCPIDPMLQQCLAQIKWDIQKTTIIPFEPRGSERSFTRIQYKKQTAIFVRYSIEREENILYTSHAQFLKRCGLNVPSVLVDAPQQRYALLEDLGDISLQELLNNSNSKKLHLCLYKKVLSEIIKLYTLATSRAKQQRIVTMPPFSEELFYWEHQFFAKRFLIDYAKIDKEKVNGILQELKGVASILLKERQVLIHRDLQSSNILFYKRKPYLIDFQGMRFGPVSYDIAALLFDPYVSLSEDVQMELLNHFNDIVPAYLKLSSSLLYIAAVQRLAQALGAYGRLAAAEETAYFSKYIPPALNMMKRAITRLQMCQKLLYVIEKMVNV